MGAAVPYQPKLSCSTQVRDVGIQLQLWSPSLRRSTRNLAIPSCAPRHASTSVVARSARCRAVSDRRGSHGAEAAQVRGACSANCSAGGGVHSSGFQGPPRQPAPWAVRVFRRWFDTILPIWFEKGLSCLGTSQGPCPAVLGATFPPARAARILSGESSIRFAHGLGVAPLNVLSPPPDLHL